MKKELIKLQCSAEEIAREKAKYPEVIKDISRIYLTTPLGKYTFISFIFRFLYRLYLVMLLTIHCISLISKGGLHAFELTYNNSLYIFSFVYPILCH